VEFLCVPKKEMRENEILLCKILPVRYEGISHLSSDLNRGPSRGHFSD